MFKKKTLTGIIIFVALTIFLFVITKNKKQETINPAQFQPHATNTSSPIEPTAIPTQLPTLTTTTQKQINTNTVVSAGPTQGNITCNFLIPSAPNHFGTVNLDLSWSNLIAGKNGYKADLCVSTNGGATQSLIISKTTQDGNSTDPVDWIAPDSNYIFTLFDVRGGDLPECAGNVLSSCQINSS